MALPALNALFLWLVFYPTIPWMGMTGLGIVLGRMFQSPSAGVARGLCLAGAGALALFLGVRLLDGFGNFHRSAPGWIGFFNLTKYPPDLAFLLLTTGINLLFLRLLMWLENVGSSGVRIMAVFGSSPLFFYIAHLYLYVFMGWAFPHGMGLAQMIPFWLGGVLILYPLCLWYGEFKQSRPSDSL